MANDALRLQLWTEEFNGVGVHRLVQLVLAWRGEVFLDALFRDEVATVFLTRYGISKPS